MIGLKIEIDDRQVRAALKNLRAAVSDLRPVLEAIGDKLESRIQQRFGLKEDPEGKQWAPWKPATEKRRVKENRGSLLVHTGLMRDSLSFAVDRDSVEVGFGRPYAQFHETGTKHMKRRGLLATESGDLPFPTPVGMNRQGGGAGNDISELDVDLLERYLALGQDPDEGQKHPLGLSP